MEFKGTFRVLIPGDEEEPARMAFRNVCEAIRVAAKEACGHEVLAVSIDIQKSYADAVINPLCAKEVARQTEMSFVGPAKAAD